MLVNILERALKKYINTKVHKLVNLADIKEA
jgi:hypothetical protein